MTKNTQIQKHIGNLLAVPRGIIVHGCNAQGVMGAGVAKVVRNLYPQAYRSYRDAYEARGLKVGEVITATVATDEAGAPALIIANAITQDECGTHRVQVDYPSISTCFEIVAKLARDTGLDVHFPLIGCGLAGGRWEEVEPRILAGLQQIPANLWVLP